MVPSLPTGQCEQVVGPATVGVRAKVFLAVRRRDDQDFGSVSLCVLRVCLAVLVLDPTHDRRPGTLAVLTGSRVGPPQEANVLVPRAALQTGSCNPDGHVRPSFRPQRVRALDSSSVTSYSHTSLVCEYDGTVSHGAARVEEL